LPLKTLIDHTTSLVNDYDTFSFSAYKHRVVVVHCVLVRQHWEYNDGSCGHVSSSENEEIYRRAIHLCNNVPARSHHVYSGNSTCISINHLCIL